MKLNTLMCGAWSRNDEDARTSFCENEFQCFLLEGEDTKKFIPYAYMQYLKWTSQNSAECV